MTQHVIFSDPHCHPYRQFSTGVGAENSRLQTTLRVIREIQDYCVENNITSAICLGDVFHSRISTRYDYFNAVFKTFAGFRERGIDLTIVCGNHDFVTKDGSVTTIDTFSEFARVITETGKIGEKLFLLAYQTNFEHLNCYLAECPPTAESCPILLTHLDIVGAKVTKGWTCDKGVEVDSFRRFGLVLSGHFHLGQQVKKNVFYIGTCCPQNFGEEGEPGYFVTLDDETAEVKWHYTSASRFEAWKPKEGEKEQNLYSRLRRNYVKVLADPSSEIDEILERAGALSWIYEPPSRTQEVQLRQKGISVDANLSDVVEHYARIHAGELPVDELTKVGKELLQ